MKTLCVLFLILATATPAFSQDLIESYVARLSANDHFNSSGKRLTSPAMIIRQDRANFHKFFIRDPEDEDDRYFHDANRRELLQKLLERGNTSRDAYRAIVNGQPLVRVNVYGSRGQAYVDVHILSE